MPRNNLLVRVAAAVVGIVAIGFAAATIESPTDPGGSGGVGEGEGSGLPTPASEPVETETVTEVPPFLEYLGLLLVALVAVVIAWYLVMNRRKFVKMVAVYLTVIAIVIALVWFLSEFGFGSPDAPNVSTEQPNGTESPGGSGSNENEQTDTFPISIGPVLLLLGTVAAVFGAVFVFSRSDATGDDEGTISAAEPADDAAAIGTVAGRAADAIDETSDEDVDNAVYRAWRDMTRHLDVDRPETSTPGEFASAAIEAGIAREHVDELTRLFEEVRYGDADTTRERETRAETVLRRIEAAYADDGGDGSNEGSTARGRPGGDDA